MTKEELALIRDYIRSLPRHNASNTEPDALTYLRLLADAIEQARQEGDALKSELQDFESILIHIRAALGYSINSHDDLFVIIGNKMHELRMISLELSTIKSDFATLRQERDEALMEGLRLTKLLEDKEIAARRPPRASGCEVVSKSYLQAVHAEITALRAHKEASEAVAVALQKSNALLHRAAPLIYRRHTMVSGSLEMAECDAACKAAGLDVWRWPKPEARDASPLEPIDVLRAIEGNLVEASNLLQDERLEENERFELLDDAIDRALLEVQYWKEEAEG